jgi:AcrR family transcriptional regulator
LEAAAQMFGREGIAATTNRIAERAGVSIGTLYQYFPNKEALLRTLAERHVADGRARLEVTFERLRVDMPPFDETMRAMLQVMVDLHSDRPGLHGVMHRLAPRTARDLDVLRDLEDYAAEEVGYHLKRCERGGDDPEWSAHAIVAAVDAHVHRAMTRRRSPDGATGDEIDRLLALVMALAEPPR